MGLLDVLWAGLKSLVPRGGPKNKASAHGPKLIGLGPTLKYGLGHLKLFASRSILLLQFGWKMSKYRRLQN